MAKKASLLKKSPKSVKNLKCPVTIVRKNKPIRKQAKTSKAAAESQYTCDYCERSFSKSVSLGGHISKAHAGKSKRFNEKMRVFVKRTEDRECLSKAKVWFREKTNLDPKDYRILITSIKKDMMTGRQPRLPTNFTDLMNN